MATFNIIYFISILVTLAVMGFIAWYSRRHRDIAGAGTYMWVALLICLLSFFDGMVMISPTKDWAQIWFNLRSFSFATIPVFWLIFVIQYIDKSNLITSPRVAALFIIPIITQIMIWTNSLHGLWVIRDISFHETGPFYIADTSTRIIGQWQKVHLVYTYTVMLTGVLLLFVTSVRMFHQYRGQAIALGAGTLIMIIGSLFPVLNLNPGSSFNPLPQSFAIGSIIIAWGIYRYRFLDRTPLFNKEKQIPVVLIMLFILLTVGIVSAGYFYYRQYKNNFRAEVEHQLSSIAELKMGQLVQWRTERLGDAAVLDRNPVFTDLARRVFDNPADAEARMLLRVWLGKTQSALKYENIRLLDIKGNTHISVPGSTGPVSRYLLQQADAINRAGKVTFLDFHRDAPDKPIHLYIVIPIIDEQKKRSIGLVIFYIDPEKYLYPMFDRWNTPSKTAEALLVRREGNDVLFLNDLKFKKNTALNLRMPLAKVELPAAMAVLGRQGIVEGMDYRGVPVVAAVRSVPDSPWYIITRMDTEEIYAPVRERLWLTICLVSLLLAGVGATVLSLWLRQSRSFYREQSKTIEELRESEKFITMVMDHLPLGLAVNSVDPAVSFTYMNDNFFKIYRTTREALADPDSFWEVVYHDSVFREKIKKRVLDDCASGDPERMHWEDIPITREGKATTYVSARNIPIPNKSLMISTVIDVTERKLSKTQIEAALEEIKKLNAELEQRVAARTAELSAKTNELERINKVFVDRELQMRELKARIAELEKKNA